MKKEILTLFMSGCSVILAAQTTGTVVDENKQPLPAATVSLFRESENKMISGVVTDMNGGFELNTHEGESYRIRISFVGYSTQEIKCQNISKHLSVGTIVLEPESKQLNDVTVTANNVIQKVDRQIIIPNLLQQKTSSNGLSLLQHLQLSRISVNTLDSKVTTTMGDAVELRINGVKAEIQEVKALLPADVLKIEYHDNPGLRYGNVAAVIDIILKEKKNGGSISGELMNNINPLGIGDYQLSGNYHVGKSNFKTSINWNRRDINWLRENMEAFNATTPSMNNYEIGQKTKARYDNINLSIGYDYINSGNILSVTFRDLYNDTPHAVFDRNSKLIQNSNTFDIMDRTKSRSNNPSLDIYYQHEFTKDKHLFFDLIGTYINTKNDRLYRQSQGNSVQEISSHVDGNKYSAIAEVIYEQKIKDSRLSFGLRHQQIDYA
ncbi:TonB-dependent receptor [Prevotella melaninogenica]|uniref:TonB-dependent receptor n=1 Tax=Prevotella melaninogenica TaxID=28132 RepID=UPI00215072C3|nr:carboxypeptidase-like regulatory domain-containing protein [Prevotella melaninogenica]